MLAVTVDWWRGGLQRELFLDLFIDPRRWCGCVQGRRHRALCRCRVNMKMQVTARRVPSCPTLSGLGIEHAVDALGLPLDRLRLNPPGLLSQPWSVRGMEKERKDVSW